MRKCPQCGQRRARFSHRNLIEKLLLVLLLRPYRCNVCMRRFWWWAWNPRQLGRHQQRIVAAGVVIVALLGSFLYLRTLPYETELPRPAGVRAEAPPSVDPAAPVGEERDAAEATPSPGPSAKMPAPEDLATQRSSDGAGSTRQTSTLDPTPEPDGQDREILGPSLPPPPPFEASALRDSGRLLDILSVADDAEIHLLLQTDAPPRTFQHFRLQAPPRLVVDIQGGWRTDLPTALVLDHALTRGLRIGQHEDMVRVVVELADDRIVPPEVRVRADGLALVLRRP